MRSVLSAISNRGVAAIAFWLIVSFTLFHSTPVLDLPAAPNFSGTEIRNPDTSTFSKWQAMLGRMKSERDATCDASCKNLQALIAGLKQAGEKEKIESVNLFFNRLPYIPDERRWGKSDYWATPQEFMQYGGDCEDYAIAKLLTLKHLGIDSDRMRIVIVQDLRKGGMMHAVLEVATDSGRLLLDNQAQQVLVEDDSDYYSPVFSINTHAWWAYRQPEQAHETLPAVGR